MLITHLVICPVCKRPIDKSDNWTLIMDMHGDTLARVDYCGVESLTEREQVLYLNEVHAECYELLE